MYNTINTSDIKGIPFGCKSIGTHIIIKLRYATATANSILEQLERNGYANDISICNTQYRGKAYTYITAVVHRSSQLSTAIKLAAQYAKANNKAEEMLQECWWIDELPF